MAKKRKTPKKRSTRSAKSPKRRKRQKPAPRDDGGSSGPH
jgi:hypothetical protein